MFAKFVVIEGADGTGKTTQAKLFAQSLVLDGKTAYVKAPFNDYVTQPIIYGMLRRGTAKTRPNLFQFVHFVNKFMMQLTVLLFYWIMCDYVVLDRWRLSSLVYGVASGANTYFNRFLNAFLFKPHFTIIIDGKIHASNDVSDSYESDDDLQGIVRMKYREWAKNNNNKCFIVNNAGDKDRVHRHIIWKFQTRING